MEKSPAAEIKRLFKFTGGKGPLIIYTMIIFAYVFFILMIAFIFTNIQDKIRLETKFDSERIFNSIYMLLNDSEEQARALMNREGVSAIGIYSTTGRAVLTYGSAPSALPLSQLATERRYSEDTTTGVYIYDEDSEEIEYFRLSRVNAVSSRSASFSEMPEIIYIKFDGSEFFSRLARIRIAAVAAIVVATVIMVLGLRIYNANRRYRIALTKHENLVSLGSAARTLTHEIKNPLSAMTIQMALLHKQLGKEYEQDLNVMDNEIERITNLTNRVSEFMKDPLGTPEKIDLVPFLTSISTLFADDVRLNFNGMGHAYVLFDDVRARSVFENLIKNATESTSDGNPEVEVEITRGRKKTFEVAVKDRGDGLPGELIETLFDPFFTTKAKGSGIGLSISRQFITAAGGKLTLSPRKGGGTQAVVTLPALEEAQ